MGWINTKDRLPDKTKKYPVIIYQDGNIKEGYCTFIKRKNKFHFDMPYINCKVIAWYKLPKFNKS